MDYDARAEQVTVEEHDEAVMEPIASDLQGKEAIRLRKINSLVSGKSGCGFKNSRFILVLQIGI